MSQKFLLAVLIVTISACQMVRINKKTHPIYIPDATTAMKIAEAIWLPIYGEKIYKEKPFKAILKNGIWIVGGTLQNNRDSTLFMGGTAYIEIRQSDCKILRVLHSR